MLILTVSLGITVLLVNTQWYSALSQREKDFILFFLVWKFTFDTVDIFSGPLKKRR